MYIHSVYTEILYNHVNLHFQSHTNGATLAAAFHPSVLLFLAIGTSPQTYPTSSNDQLQEVSRDVTKAGEFNQVLQIIELGS